MKTNDLITMFGSRSNIARFLGISPQAVYQWPGDVPRAWGYEIQVRTGGAIKYCPPAGSDLEQLLKEDFCTFKQKYIRSKV